MRLAAAALVCACLLGCGAETPGAESASSAENSPVAEEKPGGSITMEGLDLRMHNYRPTVGEPEKPTFWVHAEKGELVDGQKSWELEQARAVVYREADEDLVLEAARGLFDETRRVARLYGGVLVTAGAVTMELAEIEWNNEEGVAKSGQPVTVVDGTSWLKASTLLLNPGEDIMRLTNVTGRIDFSEGTS